jgi:hypothetical protein
VGFCGSVSTDGGNSSGDPGLLNFGGVNYLNYVGDVQNYDRFGNPGTIIFDSNNIVMDACN